MKKTTKLFLALGLASTLVVAGAFGQSNQPPAALNAVWTLYETGTSFFNGIAPQSGGGVYSVNIVGYVNGSMQADPVSGMTTLFYNLGAAAGGATSLAGDVLLLEPQTYQPSDLLRFDGLGGVYFFSDMEPGETNPDPADVPYLPPAINPVILYETGPEGNNGANYNPGPGMPGYDVSGLLPGVQYVIISDIVPEPGCASLLVSSAVLWGFSIARRARRALEPRS